MSRHSGGFAPATRVASRKLGPVAGSPCDSSTSSRAAWPTSTFASTCGQVADRRHQAVVDVGRDRGRAARRARSASGRAARRARRSCARSASGTRWRPRTAPPARARRRPPRRPQADARRRTARGRSRRARRRQLLEHGELHGADVGHDAVAAALERRARAVSATCAHRRAYEADLRARRAPPRPTRTRSSIAPRSSARSSAPGSGSHPATVAPSTRRRAARPIEPPIRPTPRTAIRVMAVPAAQSADSSFPTVCRHALHLLHVVRRSRPPAPPAGRRRSPPRDRGAPRR